MSVTDSQEAFAAEFSRMKANIDKIFESLQKGIEEIMDSTIVSDQDKKRY